MKKLNAQPTTIPLKTRGTETLLKEAGKYETLKPEECNALKMDAMKGDQYARTKLVNHNLKLVYYIAARYNATFSHEGAITFNDLVSAGYEGLLSAIDSLTWEQERSSSFMSYATVYIQGKIVSLLYEHSYDISTTATFGRVLGKIRYAEEKCAREHEDESLTMVEETFFQYCKKEIPLSVQQTGYRHEKHEKQKLIFSDLLMFRQRMPRFGEPYAIEFNPEKAMHTWKNTEEFAYAEESADGQVKLDSLRKEIFRSLNTLTCRERDVLVLFFGLKWILTEEISALEKKLKKLKSFKYADKSQEIEATEFELEKKRYAHGLDEGNLDQIGAFVDLLRERTRQLKEKAIRRLRHRSRSRNLRGYLG